ncbi:MAG: right-handed parallel beta-helix repeat-containing protein [Nitrososphaeraceae archaeon]
MTKHIIVLITLLVPLQFLGPASSSSNICATYEPADKTITVTCKTADIAEIYDQLRNEAVLHQESEDGIWLLNANLMIANNSILYINSSDTKWLKISADDERALEVSVNGSLKIDSVRITSWSTEKNDFARLEEEDTSVPRPYIRIEPEATGTTDITNSELAYLGYNGDRRSGLNYYGGNGSQIKENDIHHLWRGFYSKGVEGINFESNHIHDNHEYGIDPHNRTSNMVIRNNTVHNNGGQGIICSLNCVNITIDNNVVHNNAGSGIMFSRNMSNSTARANTIYQETECLFVSDSHNNKVYNNTISQCENALYLKAGSSNNTLYDNTIKDSTDGIIINDKSENNIFESNSIINTEEATKVERDSKNNIFLHSKIIS